MKRMGPTTTPHSVTSKKILAWVYMFTGGIFHHVYAKIANCFQSLQIQLSRKKSQDCSHRRLTRDFCIWNPILLLLPTKFILALVICRITEPWYFQRVCSWEHWSSPKLFINIRAGLFIPFCYIPFCNKGILWWLHWNCHPLRSDQIVLIEEWLNSMEKHCLISKGYLVWIINI